MLKEIIKYGMIAAVFYGIYKLVEAWPLESIIVLGIIGIILVIYWLVKLE